MPKPLKPPPKDAKARGMMSGISSGFVPTDAHGYAYQVIAATSVMDVWRQEMFTKLLGGSDSVGAAAYLAINTRGPKTAAIDAAAKNVLGNGDEYRIFKAIVKAGECLEKFRDQLAHWQEFRSGWPTNGLLLKDPRVTPVRGRAPHAGVFVFVVDEFKRSINYAAELSSVQHRFSSFLDDARRGWSPTQLADLDQKLERLANLRQQL